MHTVPRFCLFIVCLLALRGDFNSNTHEVITTRNYRKVQEHRYSSNGILRLWLYSTCRRKRFWQEQLD